MTTTQHDIDSPENLARRRHGRDVLSRIDGDRGEAVIDSLADVSPALGHHVAASASGDIDDRPGLDARSRRLVTLGVLTALGGCAPGSRSASAPLPMPASPARRSPRPSCTPPSTAASPGPSTAPSCPRGAPRAGPRADRLSGRPPARGGGQARGRRTRAAGAAEGARPAAGPDCRRRAQDLCP